MVTAQLSMPNHQREFEEILAEFTLAVESNDGERLAGLFTHDGVYHDGFYGAFVGREAIAEMLTRHFWGSAEGYKWRMYDAVSNGSFGYARYHFSYSSTLPGYEGKKVQFTGISQFQLLNGKISCYREEFNSGVALTQLSFPDGRIAGHLRKKVKALLTED